jgi:hypothetical protein
MVSLAKVWVGGETVGGSTEDETVNIKIPVDEQGEVNQMEQTEGGKIAKKVNVSVTSLVFFPSLTRWTRQADSIILSLLSHV